MNSIIDKAKRHIEKVLGLKIYRHSLPHGVDPLHDITRHLGRLRFRTVFDVGANIGQTALNFSESFPEAHIYSFEPVPATFQQLKNNTEQLKRVKAFNLAFGELSAQLPMVLHEDSRLNTLTIDPNAGRTALVEVVTLDKFVELKQIDSIDFLKVDTEGHDLKVLKGGEKFLGNGKVRFIQVEVGFGETSVHIGLDEFTEYLKSRGFALFGVYDQQPYWTGEPWLMYANAIYIRK